MNYKKENKLNNVLFRGNVPHSEIADEFSKTHIFVSASRMEVQSLVIIEALASGTPVVALSNETVDELISEKNGARLSQNSSPERFADEIKRILKLSQKDYNYMCRHAKEASKQFDWNIILEDTVKMYNELKANIKKTKISSKFLFSIESMSTKLMQILA